MSIDWLKIREQFSLRRDVIHMDHMLLSSYPAPVDNAVRAELDGFNRSPSGHWLAHVERKDPELFATSAAFLDADPDCIVLTDSATMGFGIILGGIQLKAGEEILLDDQCHYSSDKAVDYAVKRTGATKRCLSLYADPFVATREEMIKKALAGIGPKTRLLYLTWVHSSTGVKLPVSDIGKAVERLNEDRRPEDQIIFMVDGVHGFGLEHFHINDLHCHIFATSCHKWLFGPRGTGLVWIHPDVHDLIEPIIPCYDLDHFLNWVARTPTIPIPRGRLLTPGGFHSFDERWSLPAAYSFHEEIGRQNIEERCHAFAALLKDGIATIPDITLITPKSMEVSTALVCFDSAHHPDPEDLIQEIKNIGVSGTVTPYHKAYGRYSPSIYNTFEDCYKAIDALAKVMKR